VHGRRLYVACNNSLMTTSVPQVVRNRAKAF